MHVLALLGIDTDLDRSENYVDPTRSGSTKLENM
jgi:hypothetical protein